MDINAYGGHERFKWTHDYLVKVITSGKSAILEDPIFINAFRSIKRGDFIPRKLAGQAYEDRDIDIGYNEKLTRPSTIAMMLRYLQPKVGGRYLDLGSGTGYFAALLSKCIGNKGIVYSLERIQWLWEGCRDNIRKYPELTNIEFLYRDGKAGLPEKGQYDGIHSSFNYQSFDDLQLMDKLKEQLKVSTGILVYPYENTIRVVRRIGIDEYEEEIINTWILDAGKEGLG